MEKRTGTKKVVITPQALKTVVWPLKRVVDKKMWRVSDLFQEMGKRTAQRGPVVPNLRDTRMSAQVGGGAPVDVLGSKKKCGRSGGQQRGEREKRRKGVFKFT